MERISLGELISHISVIWKLLDKTILITYHLLLIIITVTTVYQEKLFILLFDYQQLFNKWCENKRLQRVKPALCKGLSNHKENTLGKQKNPSLCNFF